MTWKIADALALIAGIAGLACIPVAIYLVIKGFFYDPMGWVRLAFGAFIWIYALSGFGGGRS
jgi:hypothetical protein